MKYQRIALSLAIFTAAGASLIVACTDESTTIINPTPDSSIDATKSDTGGEDVVQPPKDGGSDAPKETGSGFNSVFDFDGGRCPIVGTGDDQANFSNATCNACISTNCCGLVQNCLQGDMDASIINADGGVTPCLERFGCFLDNCANEVDAGGCALEKCDPNFSAATNAAAVAMMKCTFGPVFGSPVTDTCSLRPADGGLLCKP